MTDGLPVVEGRIIGRKVGAHIDDLTPAETRAIVAPGGTTAQVWTKASDDDGDADWEDAAGGGGAPSGPAGGDLSDTYPNPTVVGGTHLTQLPTFGKFVAVGFQGQPTFFDPAFANWDDLGSSGVAFNRSTHHGGPLLAMSFFAINADNPAGAISLSFNINAAEDGQGANVVSIGQYAQSTTGNEWIDANTAATINPDGTGRAAKFQLDADNLGGGNLTTGLFLTDSAWQFILGAVAGQTDPVLKQYGTDGTTLVLQSDINGKLTLNAQKIAGLADGTLSTDAAAFGQIGSAISTHAGASDPHGDRAYAAGLFAANDALVYKGAIDCSANPNYPAADAGHAYKVSVAGKIGGASGINVEVGDLLVCTVDSTASGNQATVGANWDIIQVNLDGAVIGPASATDNGYVAFNGTSGRLVKAATDPLARANHTGTQSADTLTDGTTNKAFLATERTKLAGIATAATANSSDATLLARANHTGTQAAATISDLASVVKAYRLDEFAAPNTNVSMASHKLTSVTDPTTAQDAATKNYVDTHPGAVPSTMILAGNYSNLARGAAATTANGGNGNVHCFPFTVAGACTIDRIGIEITSGVASSVIRLGIYSDNGRGYPGSLLVEFTSGGTLSGASTAVVEMTISQALVPGVLYWAAYCPQSGASAPTVRYTSQTVWGNFSTTQSDARNNTARVEWVDSAGTGALPGTFTTTPSAFSGNAPSVFVRGV